MLSLKQGEFNIRIQIDSNDFAWGDRGCFRNTSNACTCSHKCKVLSKTLDKKLNFRLWRLAKDLALPSHSYIGMANALSGIYAIISRPPVLSSECASSPTSKVGCVHSNLVKVALWLSNSQEANLKWCEKKIRQAAIPILACHLTQKCEIMFYIVTGR